MELHNILGLFSNQVLLCCITAWFVAQALKIPTYYLVEKKWDWHRFFGSGGMPSSHTAFVVSLTLMIGATQGFDSAIFALSFTMAAIVMYDAPRDGQAGGYHQRNRAEDVRQWRKYHG